MDECRVGFLRGGDVVIAAPDEVDQRALVVEDAAIEQLAHQSLVASHDGLGLGLQHVGMEAEAVGVLELLGGVEEFGGTALRPVDAEQQPDPAVEPVEPRQRVLQYLEIGADVGARHVGVDFSDIVGQRIRRQWNRVDVRQIGEHRRDRGPHTAVVERLHHGLQRLVRQRRAVRKVVDHAGCAGADHGDAVDQGADVDLARRPVRILRDDVQHVDVERLGIDRALQQRGV